MYFDALNTRRPIGGDGISFIYGDANNEDEIVLNTETELYDFPRDKIFGRDIKRITISRHYLVGDIIINSDGTFYCIEEIYETKVGCSKLLVAGAGGGGIVSNKWLTMDPDGFPSVIPYGEKCSGRFRVLKSSGGTVANFIITIKDNNVTTQIRETIHINNVQVGERVTLDIDAKYLAAG